MQHDLNSVAVLGETRLDLKAAAEWCSKVPGGRRTHRSTIARWVLTGVSLPGGGRVRLEAVRLAGKWVTSVEALLRFASVQTQAHLQPSTTARDGKAHPGSPRVAAALDKLGI